MNQRTVSLPRWIGGGLLAILLLAGCGKLATFLEDNGTHLAYALEKGVAELKRSGATELVVRYTTLDDPGQGYYVEITPSRHPASTRPDVWGSYLVVSGKTSGGTSYHNRFVFVPQRLHLVKDQGGATEVVLRKEGDRVSVVALR